MHVIARDHNLAEKIASDEVVAENVIGSDVSVNGSIAIDS